MLPPNFEVPVYEAMVEGDEEIPDEIRWMLEREGKAIQPHQEEIEIVNLGTEEDKKEIKIGALLDATVKERVIELLREYADIFAWSYKDMPGIDAEVVEHRLPLKPECPPVKQKLRRSHPEMALKIKEEVRKQIDAGFLITSEYPQWLANIVPVPKKDGKVRMCVDYRDLNKASPKMISLYLTSMYWLIILLNAKCSPSWMVSPGIIRSRWLLKIERRHLSSRHGALFAIR